MKRITKDPSADLDYSWDWTVNSWLAAGETITTAAVTVPDGLTLGTVSQAAGVVTAWIRGGTAGQEYEVVCRITTSEGRVDDRTILLRCQQR